MGNQVIPSLNFSDVQAGTVSPSTIDEIRHRGVAVIRNVFPRSLALDLKSQAQSYIAANRGRVKAFPPEDPAVYELYWSPSQTAARAHPHMLRAQSFLASLWHSSDPNSQLSTTYPLTYADRLRIRKPGDGKFALGPHTDGGSVERWEDVEYSRVYQAIFSGDWESYDPFDARHRIRANMNMYNGAGGCSAFRLFQGWLSMSSTGPGEGTLRVCPLLKHATAYVMLRPYFQSPSHAISQQHGSPLDFTPTLPGSVPAAAQEYNSTTHPDLRLDETMVSIPAVDPGDYVAWHCDGIHAVDAHHRGTHDSSVLYIPACAMTPGNLDFLLRQRRAALSYSPPPDFPGAGGAAGTQQGEMGFRGAVDWEHDLSQDGLRAMGLGEKKWEVLDHMSEGEREVVELGNRLLFD